MIVRIVRIWVLSKQISLQVHLHRMFQYNVSVRLHWLCSIACVIETFVAYLFEVCVVSKRHVFQDFCGKGVEKMRHCNCLCTALCLRAMGSPVVVDHLRAVS